MTLPPKMIAVTPRMTVKHRCDRCNEPTANTANFRGTRIWCNRCERRIKNNFGRTS